MVRERVPLKPRVAEVETVTKRKSTQKSLGRAKTLISLKKSLSLWYLAWITLIFSLKYTHIISVSLAEKGAYNYPSFEHQGSTRRFGMHPTAFRVHQGVTDFSRKAILFAFVHHQKPISIQSRRLRHISSKNFCVHSKVNSAFQPSPVAQQFNATAVRDKPTGEDKFAKYMPMYDKNGKKYTLYERCVRRLYLTNMFHPVKMGLDNMHRMYEELGRPLENPNMRVIHVAGTNGKGSVCYKLANVYRNAGYTTGLFVSPHVSSFRERLQVNGELISEKEVEELLPKIYSLCEKHSIEATFFEITTALAFQFFAARDCDIVVLETGLGGRLDATNVLKKPDLCVITSIGLEHTRILGDTIEEIAAEKAGIIKKDVPVLIGPNVPVQVVKDSVEAKGATGYLRCEDVLSPEDWAWGKDTISRDGIKYIDYDIENSRITTAAVKLLEQQTESISSMSPISVDHIKEGVSRRPPCRFEELKVSKPMLLQNYTTDEVTVILDVAHNPPAMDLLVAKLDAMYPSRPKRIVVGFSADKDLALCGKSLLSIVPHPSSIHLVEAAHPRAAKLEEIIHAEPLLRDSNFAEDDRTISYQVKSALEKAFHQDEVLVICGSVFLMSEAREALGIDEPRDSKYIAEVAGSGMRNSQENFGDTDPEPMDDSPP